MLLAADAFVSLSWRENFGYALAEAAAAGLCCAVAPDHDLVADMPTECRQWVAKDHTLAESSRVIQTLLATNRAVSKGIGGVARNWVSQRLSRERFDRVVRNTTFLGSAYDQ